MKGLLFEIAERLTAVVSLTQEATNALATAPEQSVRAVADLGFVLDGTTNPDALDGLATLRQSLPLLHSAAESIALARADIYRYAKEGLGAEGPFDLGGNRPLGLHPWPGENGGGPPQPRPVTRRPPAIPPTVSDPLLARKVRPLFKGITNEKRLGDGTTMDAIRNERATGLRTGGREHEGKGRDAERGLVNWLRGHPTASSTDRAAARSMIHELREALGTPDA